MTDSGNDVERLTGLTTHEVLSPAQALGKLRLRDNLYRAAFPGYESNFTRDGAHYALLSGDLDALEAQFDYSAVNQGVGQNPFTGEERGKPHHELPGGSVRGGNTQYNACDAAALQLISGARLIEHGRSEVVERRQSQVMDNLDYILSHIDKDGIFYEDPQLAGAEDFDLRVTYWKDSYLKDDSGDGLPRYPIVFSLVHFQNAYALKAIGTALQSQELVQSGDAMTKAGIAKLWADDHFVTAIDELGVRDSPNSDSLHALLYIEPEQLPAGYAEKIQSYMALLEVAAGYRTGLPTDSDKDQYHTKFVWTQEQAWLHAAAKKHSLAGAMGIAARVRPFLSNGQYPELLDPTNESSPAGQGLQLWAVGAHLYFEHPERVLY